jgi:DNA adenine methylase
MGEKNRLLSSILEQVTRSRHQTVVDAFSGSGCVGHFLKRAGYRVISNDVLDLSFQWSIAGIENNDTTLSPKEVEFLISRTNNRSRFIAETFQGIYFTDDENHFLDKVRSNIELLDNRHKRAIALASLSRACLKKRPRGIFTYVGQRYDDGRRDVHLSLHDHFREAVDEWNNAVFDNGSLCEARRGSALDLEIEEPAIWYLDPPYYSVRADNDYTRRYHFVEGLVNNWQEYQIQPETKTKKFKSPYRDFQYREAAYSSLMALFEKRANDDLVISYSSNSLPTKQEMCLMLESFGREVDVIDIPHTYAFGTHSGLKRNTNNRVNEYLFFSPAIANVTKNPNGDLRTNQEIVAA